MITYSKSAIKGVISSLPLTSIIKSKKFIFGYHDISNENEIHHSEFYSTRIDDFYNQITVLGKIFKFIPLDQLLSTDVEPNRELYASIVFDDGFYSVYKTAFPFLIKNNIPFTVFVNKTAVLSNQLWVTNLILNKGNQSYLRNFYDSYIENKPANSFAEFCKNPFNYALKEMHYSKTIDLENIANDKKLYCDEEDLKSMYNSGMVGISSHSTNHYVLSKCSDEMLKNDLSENKEFVKRLTFKNDEHFAVPFGSSYYDERLISLCKELNYKYIHTSNPNNFTNKDLKGDLSLVPRICIDAYTIKEMLFKINLSFFKRT